MENLRGIKVTFLQATDTKPSRQKLTDLRYNKTVILGASQNAADYLKEKGISIKAQTWSEKNGRQEYTILLTDNFSDEI